MDKFFRQKKLAAVLFLFSLFGLSFLNIRSAWSPLLHTIATLPDISVSRSSAEELESVVNESVYQKELLIDAFGYLQRLIYKNEQSDFETVKDKAGLLHEADFGSGTADTLTLAENLRRFQSDIGGDVPVLYVMTPDKNIPGFTSFPTGIPYSRANETADSFLRMLSLYNIDAVDLRERISASGIAPDELFYKTDDRWTTQSGFWAFGELAGLLWERYGISLDTDGFFTDPNSYNHLAYPASHLGRLGEKAGKYYAGMDDFTVIYPKFDTDYTLRMGNGSLDEYTLSGRFEDTLLSSEPFLPSDGADYLPADKYSSYRLAGMGVAHIKNNLNPDGPKIAFFSDTMLTPTLSFLSSLCSDVYMIDPIRFTGNVNDFLDGSGAEVIIVSYCPQNLRAYLQ